MKALAIILNLGLLLVMGYILSAEGVDGGDLGIWALVLGTPVVELDGASWRSPQ